MNVYKVYNLFILHSILQEAFQYPLKEEYLALSSDGDYATIPSGHDAITMISTNRDMLMTRAEPSASTNQ